jgi:lipopolysaccharide biosynthesis regulator YciM
VEYVTHNRNYKAVIKIQLVISRLLRKDGEYDKAIRLAQHAHGTAIDAFGPASVQACMALREQ